MYPIRQIDRLQAEDLEYLGTKRKFWFTSNGQRFLFKAEERGTGEDWAEKVVCELAGLLGIPHVDYDLAHEFEGQRPIQPGVLCPTFVPRPQILVLGNQLLVIRDPAYPAAKDRKYGLAEYTVEAVADVASVLKPPAPKWMQGTPAGITTALGVFIGYVMLDAWVANQDRHHQNWDAIVQAPDVRLAPTFDHGASLARNLTDDERKERLRTRDQNRTVQQFCTRARSGFYSKEKKDKTVLALDVFRRLAERDPGAAQIWLRQACRDHPRCGRCYSGRDSAAADVASDPRIYIETPDDEPTPPYGGREAMNALLVASRSASPDKGGWSPIGRLQFEGGIYRFVYTNGARTAPGFAPFSGMEDLDEVYESVELFPIFANRLLSKSRPEYEAYLRWSGFDPANPPDPIAVLGVTEGIRRTDMIELFPCPVPDEEGCYLNKFFLHGVRYMPEFARERVIALKDEEPLALMLDICNPADRNAVALRTTVGDPVMIGYVPRYLAHDAWKIVQDCHPDFIRIFAHRVNRDAPLQQRLLCRMQSCWPEGFQPCSGAEFQPIPQDVPVHCGA